MQPRSDSSLLRLVNSQRIVDELFALAPSPVSRAGLSRSTGLSKPTVSAVVAGLEDAHLIQDVVDSDSLVRSQGRPPSFFELAPEAGLVVGVDVGATYILVGAANLLGEVVSEQEFVTPSDGREAIALVTREAQAMLSSPQGQAAAVRRVAVGVPGIYNRDNDSVVDAWNIGGFSQPNFGTSLETALGVAVDVDNEANMAARAEAWLGEGHDVDHFATISIGIGIGMGVVVDGMIHRGMSGAAGEIGHYEVPVSVGDRLTLAQIESVASAAAIVEQYQTIAGLPEPTNLGVADIIDMCDRDESARQAVNGAAQALARVISAACAILDPELLILGGGVGSNPLFVQHVHEILEEMDGDRAVKVAPSTLGRRAALLGAIDTALQGVRESLVADILFP
jgi:predicted NBD/HSP70 family sugar kinase